MNRRRAEADLSDANPAVRWFGCWSKRGYVWVRFALCACAAGSAPGPDESVEGTPGPQGPPGEEEVPQPVLRLGHHVEHRDGEHGVGPAGGLDARLHRGVVPRAAVEGVRHQARRARGGVGLHPPKRKKEERRTPKKNF